MHLNDAIELISSPALLSDSPTQWADLGCGSGLFTNALARMLPAGSIIYAVDKNLNDFKIDLPGNIVIKEIKADFIYDKMDFNDLNGIIMANSLHFVSDKAAFIRRMSGHFKPQSMFLIVEYDTDIPNPWVPFPISFAALQEVFKPYGFNVITKIHQVPSKYNRENIYSALIKHT